MQSLSEILSESKHIKVRQFERFTFADRDKMKEAFISAFHLVDKTFETYKHPKEYDQVIDWLCDTECKGLYLIGGYGRGKSTILTGVIPLLFKAVYNRHIHSIAAVDLTKELHPIICIDDIGTEHIINDYGTKVDPVEYAISHCEDHTKLLLMTGNVGRDDLAKRYGVRIVDRINRLCKVVEFNGNSFRK